MAIEAFPALLNVALAVSDDYLRKSQQPHATQAFNPCHFSIKSTGIRRCARDTDPSLLIVRRERFFPELDLPPLVCTANYCLAFDESRT
jgi:hypothetical protein